ncbi:MAG: hypothetical protein ACRYFR_17155 [Janthinobacterium lividum]
MFGKAFGFAKQRNQRIMSTIKQVPLGRQGLTVSVEGLGCRA